MTDVIDVRGRPTSLDPFYGSTPERIERIAWVNRRVGSETPEHFTRSPDTASFVAEASAAGISRSVVLGRQVPIAWIHNDRVAELASEAPSLVGVGAVDPSNPETGGVIGAVEEVRRAVEELGLAGINVDPGFGVTAMLPNDRRLYPVYAACEGLGVPVFVMSGPLAGPTLEFTLPRHFGAVANDFPELDLVIAHGAYPFVSEAIGVAYKHERVLLSPDIYTFMPGAEAYTSDLEGFLGDQFLFGTGYPFRPMAQTLQEYLALPLSEERRAAVLYANAARLFDL